MRMKFFDLKERHDIDELDLEFLNKNFFTNKFYYRHIYICNSNKISYNKYDNNIYFM